MKLVLAALCAVMIAANVFAQPAASSKPDAAKSAAPVKSAEVPKTEEQKTFYALGLYLSEQVSIFNLSAAELKYVQMGFKDAVLNNPHQVELQVYGPKLNDLAKSRVAVKSSKEKEKSKDFLAKAAKEPGAQGFPSGLIYKEIKAGSGASPTAADTIKAHYHGTLVDGTVFDSSVQRGQPAEFPVQGVIKCWQEGIPKMKVGGKAKLICPSDIAYGDRGNSSIPGGATLIFEVELLEIVKPSVPESAPKTQAPAKKP
ncbi:MAG TPA: peptidylprolyl isomerase [Elusimicrobia bacterium]|nr:peptidylprolyl isomerase [Elusimicrobiota bacterium]HBT62159.1 peptidylprolyl isomerase [Elusimicrobiota bacterium]